MLLHPVSPLVLFLWFGKWRLVYCLRCNLVLPVFLLMPGGFANCSSPLCGQSVQFIDSVNTVFLNENVRWSPDNGSKYHRVWWHLADVDFFSSQKRFLFLRCLQGNWSMDTFTFIPIYTNTEIRGMWYFHRINMLGLFKRQSTGWDYMYIYEVQCDCHPRPGWFTSPQAWL